MHRLIPPITLVLLALVPALSAQEVSSTAKFRSGDFKLVYQGRAADLLVAAGDFNVVQIAAGDLAADIERVTGRRPKVVAGPRSGSRHAVIIGTLGHSPLIDDLAKRGKLDTSRISGKWESFLIAAVKDPLPGVDAALVIAGSDRRGTAYGVYELSQLIGVSPWYWWADVTPERKNQLLISPGVIQGGEPSVKYRGIFLNDEDWGLQPWAAKTFEPETGDIGPKTYAKIFELLLRLKANTVWPAMHEVTRPFNANPANRKVADDYAIVMGSSHAEPMLRNNVGEWKAAKDDYNFVTNPARVTSYWEERVRENGKYENIYTLGMRGIHDSPIQGAEDQTQRILLLEKIFDVQRSLLAKHVTPEATPIPQIFCPYKEVLSDYRAGLRVPDDVTVVFPDDNFGYIRQFPGPEEEWTSGGYGVYYHLSYLGRPLSYLWLNTTPPALIWEELSKAYDHGMQRFWVLNVGDLKPGEVGIEFFLQLAWDIEKWRRENLPDFLREWATREFGATHANEIAEMMDGYYRLGYARKPEHLQWYLPNESPRSSDLSAVHYGDEIQVRLDAYAALRARAEGLAELLPPDKRDAFYELVLYPIRSAASANERVFALEKATLYFAQERASAQTWAERARTAGSKIDANTWYFNQILAGGKWRFIMSPEMGLGQWPSMRTALPTIPGELRQVAPLREPPYLGVAIEGDERPLDGSRAGVLPLLDVFTQGSRFIDVFNRGSRPSRWTARANQSWIKLSQTGGSLRDDVRVWVSVDWRRAPVGEVAPAEVEISTVSEPHPMSVPAAPESRTVKVPIFNPASPRPGELKGFVESNQVVSMEAEHFTRKVDRNGAGWQPIFGLGRTGDSMAIFPTTVASVESKDLKTLSSVLEYDFYSFTGGEYDALCYLLPTQPLVSGRGLRYAIGVDDQEPRIVTVGADTEVSSPKWALNVLNATTVGASKLDLAPGRHVLRIYMVDAAVVLDKIVLSIGAQRRSYLGPPETMVRK